MNLNPINISLPVIFILLIFTSTKLIQSSGRKIPSVDVNTMDGKTFNTSNISNNGKPIVISIWETTCKPCINELDAIAEVYNDWKKETGVKVVAVSIDNTRTSGNVPSMVKTKGWDYEVYLDKNQDFKRALNIDYCPITYVVNGKGEIVWQKKSYAEGDEDKLYEIVKKVAKGEKIIEQK